MALEDRPCVPFVWPDFLPAGTGKDNLSTAPWKDNFLLAALAGVSYDLDEKGINWLGGLLGKPKFQCRLILLLYPACATNENHLEHMLGWKERHGNRVEIRLLPVHTHRLTILSILPEGNSKALLAVGATPNLGVGAGLQGIANLLFQPDSLVLSKWCRWFDQLWENSVPLTPESAEIPPLTPAPGSPNAARMWSEYVRKCFALLGTAKDTPEPKQSTLEETTSEPQRSVTTELGILQTDVLTQKVADLYTKGTLVSIDKSTRLPPLVVPIKPEWFGLRSFQQFGSASRRISCHVSVFTEEERRSIENKTKAMRDLLDRFSFSLGDAQWWMPNAARPLFEAELDHVNEEGVKELKALIGGEVKSFIEARKEQVLRDTEDLYQEFFPGRPLPRSARERVLEALERRLAELEGERLLPRVSFSQVQPLFETQSGWANPWAQARRLLEDIAEFPRKVVTNQYFQRGFDKLKAKLSEVVEAMDVCKDPFAAEVKKSLERGGYFAPSLDTQAREDLQLIREVKQASALNDQEKCEALFLLIEGKREETRGYS